MEASVIDDFQSYNYEFITRHQPELEITTKSKSQSDIQSNKWV